MVLPVLPLVFVPGLGIFSQNKMMAGRATIIAKTRYDPTNACCGNQLLAYLTMPGPKNAPAMPDHKIAEIACGANSMATLSAAAKR